MSENVSLFDRLIMKVTISHNLVSVWTLIVRELLALGIDFRKNLRTLNECMILEMMKAVIVWISHLAKQLTLFMNDESFAPMLSLNMIDWIEP